MSDFVFAPPAQASIAVQGSQQRLPIRRVFCVGRNYEAHAREMGNDPSREPPFFFMKPADAVMPAAGTVPYPPLRKTYTMKSKWWSRSASPASISRQRKRWM